MMVMTSECPPVGVAIQLTVLLPRRRGRGQTLELHGEGVVVRVQGQGAGSKSSAGRPNGFVASVQFYPELPESSEHLN